MSVTAIEDERAKAEAAGWLARLAADDAGEADGEAFDAWLEASEANRAAYARALTLMSEFEAAADAVAAELGRAKRRPAAVGRRWLVGGFGIAAAAALAVAVLPDVVPGPQPVTYATGKGEHRRVALDDGSTVDLNAETRLTVRLGRRERHVTLAEGEAIFDVAHAAQRPFTVAASGRTVRVVGTQFDVSSRDGQLAVTVARGRVQVEPPRKAPEARAYLLTPGQRLAVARSGAVQVATVDPLETFSWRAGRLVYREQPLGEVVADLNRQFPEVIEIGDPELAAIPITGVIVLDDARSVTQRLSLMLPIRSVPSERGVTLLKK